MQTSLELRVYRNNLLITDCPVKNAKFQDLLVLQNVPRNLFYNSGVFRKPSKDWEGVQNAYTLLIWD